MHLPRFPPARTTMDKPMPSATQMPKPMSLCSSSMARGACWVRAHMHALLSRTAGPSARMQGACMHPVRGAWCPSLLACFQVKLHASSTCASRDSSLGWIPSATLAFSIAFPISPGPVWREIRKALNELLTQRGSNTKRNTWYQQSMPNAAPGHLLSQGRNQGHPQTPMRSCVAAPEKGTQDE